jgi:DNA-binding PadR family transcriptional regulator
MRSSKRVSLLGYAILGLIQQQPVSGYTLRKIFTATPMGSFSDSPGAIYPALARLEADGLIQGTVEDGAGLRRRKIYRLKPAGAAVLRKWYAHPVTREDVVRGMSEMLLRFAFLGDAADRAATERFLTSLQEQLAAYVPELEAYAAEHQRVMSLSGKLALDHGIRGFRASLEWAEAALATLARQEKGGTS